MLAKVKRFVMSSWLNSLDNEEEDHIEQYFLLSDMKKSSTKKGGNVVYLLSMNLYVIIDNVL